jgi:hypothetical protein
MSLQPFVYDGLLSHREVLLDQPEVLLHVAGPEQSNQRLQHAAFLSSHAASAGEVLL